jgi:hypothetical protein
MKIRRYNGKTLKELCEDEDYQTMIKPFRKSWSGNIFSNISFIRKKWIIDFKSCPWQDLVRIYKFVKMIRKEGVTSPMIDKLIQDCLDEVKCRVKKKELKITIERS